MSAALNAADASAQTSVDFSLGSFASGFSTPGSNRNLRVPSATSQTTAPSSAPLSTPSPPHSTFVRRRLDDASAISKRNVAQDDEGDDADGDYLKTPGRPTPAASRAKQFRNGPGSSKGATLTLRDQEKHIDNLKKENFNIKLKVHFLEERLAQLAPDQIDAALKQNINLKIEVQQRGMELKKLKKIVLELQQELERFQRGSSGARSRERELEEKLEERERELRDLRRRRPDERDDEALQEAEAHNAQLEEELDNVRGLLEENMEELDRLRDIVERRADDSAGEVGEGRRERYKRKIEELEEENDDLRARLDDLADLVARRQDEKEDLMDEVEGLRLAMEDLERKREAESLERSQSRVQILEEREEREAVEDDLNALRDKLAAATIELQQKEDDLEVKNTEIQELVAEHQRIVELVEQEWRGEVEETRNQVEELRDVLAERDAEAKDLRENIAELERGTEDVHAKFEVALVHLEKESDEKDTEIENANRDIERLGQQVYLLEEENDRLKDEMDRVREDEGVERDRLQALSNALKEKIAGLKSQLQDAMDRNEAYGRDIVAHRTRQEELARHIEDLVEELHHEREGRESLEMDLEKLEKEHDAAIRRERRSLEAKESALQSALDDLSRAQSLLTQRESDLNAVQTALQTLEAESKRAGETHTTARFSLQLEVDRLKRDLERLENELARARKDTDEREAKARDRDGSLDKLHAENRDLASQLAAQTQARLNVAEKLDSTQTALKAAEAELASFRTRVTELEQRLSKDQRSLLTAESQYRDQLTERNTLLLTIYQYMDKILGVDKTPKKSGQAETKPFTNFGVFHDNLITRLKALSQVQLDFDKRAKETEARYTEKLNDIRKQLDNRWKQIDKFESSVKSYAETKATWRKKLSVKEGELEALKTINSDLTVQLNAMRKPGQGDTMEIRALQARANNAERRLINAQNQLTASEERISVMNQKTAVADNKWEARVKEYEIRIKSAEERVKRERQGGKERVAELENSLKTLQRQLDLAQKRSQQLADLVDANKVPASPAR